MGGSVAQCGAKQESPARSGADGKAHHAVVSGAHIRQGDPAGATREVTEGGGGGGNGGQGVIFFFLQPGGHP